MKVMKCSLNLSPLFSFSAVPFSRLQKLASDDASRRLMALNFSGTGRRLKVLWVEDSFNP